MDVTSEKTFEHPFGENARGKITYTDDGYMFVMIESAQPRPNWASEDISIGTDQERTASTKGFISYCRKYELKNDSEIVHHVEMSFFPNWIGTSQLRYYKFQDGKLIISTPELILNGESVKNYLTWEMS